MKLAQSTEMIRKGLQHLPPTMSKNIDRVLVAMLAIGLQESKFEHKFQVVNTPGVKGPARGFWQFESGGGVKGIMRHPASKPHLEKACRELGVPFEQRAIWLALEHNDDLAVVCARLLLYTDAKALPLVPDEQGMWEYYLRNWRPGAYDRGTKTQRVALRTKWAKYYEQAMQAAKEYLG